MTDDRWTVFLDAGDTLFYLDPPLHEVYAHIINDVKSTRYSGDTLQNAIRDLHDSLPLVAAGCFRYSDAWFELFIGRLLDSLDCPRPWNGVTDRLFEVFEKPGIFTIFSDVTPCLKELSELNIRTGIISNWGYRLSRLLDRLDLLQGFSVCLASAEVELEKPDPAIFQLALARTGSVPENAFHIGDSLENDVMGAREAGIHGILLDRNDQFPDIDHRIRSLEELVPYLRKAGMP